MIFSLTSARSDNPQPIARFLRVELALLFPASSSYATCESHEGAMESVHQQLQRAGNKQAAMTAANLRPLSKCTSDVLRNVPTLYLAV